MNDGPLDAETLLLNWYCELQAARCANCPNNDHLTELQREYDLRNLEHHVLFAMSRMLPHEPYDLALIEPTKARGQLSVDRYRCARSVDPDPVVVMEITGTDRVTLLDGHHRFYRAKDAGHHTLQAVTIPPCREPKMERPT